jgi:hypothetical protein
MASDDSGPARRATPQFRPDGPDLSQNSPQQLREVNEPDRQINNPQYFSFMAANIYSI